jgi:hypothetical protein
MAIFFLWYAFLARQVALGSSCVFPFLVIEFSFSPVSTGLFYWEIEFGPFYSKYAAPHFRICMDYLYVLPLTS